MGDIGSILGLIALVGFLMVAGGIGLIVLSVSQGRPIRGGILLVIIGLVVGILFSIVGSGVVVVEPTQVAIVVNSLSGQVDEPKRGGLHIIVPIFQRVAIFYPITQLEYTMSATSSEGSKAGNDAIIAQSKDGQTVTLDVTILFRVIPDKADKIYLDLQANYVDTFVRPVTRSLVREVAARYTAEEIYGAKRATLGDEMRNEVATEFAKKSFELTDLLIRDITFSDAFRESIEKKVVALQDLERTKTEAETAQTSAKGRANAAIEAARGEAEAVKLRAVAQAEALRVVSEQIAANPMLIQYLYVTNLSDNVSLVLVPSNSAFLFDPTNLPQANPNFTPPDVPAPTTPSN